MSTHSTATAIGLPGDQTATPGVDYTSTSGSVFFADNDTVASLAVTVLHVRLCDLQCTVIHVLVV